jgi:hypothetical protein
MLEIIKNHYLIDLFAMSVMNKSREVKTVHSEILGRQRNGVRRKHSIVMNTYIDYYGNNVICDRNI